MEKYSIHASKRYPNSLLGAWHNPLDPTVYGQNFVGMPTPVQIMGRAMRKIPAMFGFNRVFCSHKYLFFFPHTIENIPGHVSVHFPTAFVQADVDSGRRDVAMIVSSPTALSLNPNDNLYGTVVGGGGGGTFALRNLYGLDPMHACVFVLRDIGGVWTPIGGPVPFGNPGTNYSAKYTTMKAGHTQFAPIRLFPPHGPLFRSVSVIKSIRLYSPDGNRKWLLAIVCHYCM